MKHATPTLLTTLACLTLTTACSPNTNTPQPSSVTDRATTRLHDIPEFKACVNRDGTPQQKAAVQHITKLTGMNDWDGVRDSAKAWTDWTGGIKHAADANLITSAFADCYQSGDGRIAVYTSDGHVAGTGEF